MNLNSEQQQKMRKLFDASMARFESKRNGAYPYQEYELLYDLVGQYKPKQILEAGTGYGMSCIALALGSDNCHIVSLDKNQEVIDVAKNNADDFGVYDRIDFVQSTFLDFLKEIDEGQYDMVFFDGFAPGLTVFLELDRVLASKGLMVCANLTLGGDRRKIKLRMEDKRYYSSIREQGDTVIGIKA